MLIKKSEIPVESWCPISTKEYPSFVEKVEFIKRHKLAFSGLNENLKKEIVCSDKETFEEIKETINQDKCDYILFSSALLLILIPISYIATKNFMGFIAFIIGLILLLSFFIPPAYSSEIQERVKEILTSKKNIK